MDTRLLLPEVQKFISNALEMDLSTVILKGSPFEGISIQELAQQIEGKQKAKKKLPLWYKTDNILFPPKLNLEQTSSEQTAAYKATIVSGEQLIDLTGGFGIDAFYFSRKVAKVVHCELNAELSNLVAHNANILEADNLTTYKGDSFEILKNSKQHFDWIYIDPSRRNDAKGKVFLLEDCLPNVPDNLSFLFEYANRILLKNSPILDIQNTINVLQYVKEIHIVALQNEVKELLFVLEKNYKGAIQVKTSNLRKESSQYFEFSLESKEQANYAAPRTYLYEPNAAILKSGGFQQIAHHYAVDKLHQHSHLYTHDELLADFPGRIFLIEEVLPYDKKRLLKVLPEKKANISIRNFPETVAQIRKKTKIKDGGSVYLFFTTNLENKRIVLKCRKTVL